MPLYDVERVEGAARASRALSLGCLQPRPGPSVSSPIPPDSTTPPVKLRHASDTDHASSFDNLYRISGLPQYSAHRILPCGSTVAASTRGSSTMSTCLEREGPGPLATTTPSVPGFSPAGRYIVRKEDQQRPISGLPAARCAGSRRKRHRAGQSQLRGTSTSTRQRAVSDPGHIRRCAQSDDRKPRAALGGKPGGVARLRSSA